MELLLGWGLSTIGAVNICGSFGNSISAIRHRKPTRKDTLSNTRATIHVDRYFSRCGIELTASGSAATVGRLCGFGQSGIDMRGGRRNVSFQRVARRISKSDERESCINVSGSLSGANFAPDQHGYPRASRLTSGKTSLGRFGTQSRGCAGQTVRPSLHSISQTSVGKLSILNVTQSPCCV